MGAPQALGHREAVDLGQHDVQDDDVVGAAPPVVDACLAVVDGIDDVAVVLQNAGECLGEANVVFHYQYMHARLLCALGNTGAIVPRRLKAS